MRRLLPTRATRPSGLCAARSRESQITCASKTAACGKAKVEGYVEGQNLAIDVRWANDDPDRLPELAADLVHQRVRVIVAIASILAVRAAKAATNTIPIY
jgi:putative ABC transport system substrate-binding protein